MSDDNNGNDDQTPNADIPAGLDVTHQQELAAASEATAAATARAEASTAALIDSTRAANPTIPPDLITGTTAEEVAASVTAGQATVEAVIAANPPDALTRPPGDGGAAPPRTLEPPADMRGSARIAWALKNQPQQ